MQYDVIPGKEAEFKAGFNGVLAHLKSTAGHMASRLYEDVSAPGSFLIVSEWEKREDFDAFLRSDAFKAVTQWGKAEILRGRPRHKVYSDA